MAETSLSACMTTSSICGSANWKNHCSTRSMTPSKLKSSFARNFILCSPIFSFVVTCKLQVATDVHTPGRRLKAKILERLLALVWRRLPALKREQGHAQMSQLIEHAIKRRLIRKLSAQPGGTIGL